MFLNCPGFDKWLTPVGLPGSALFAGDSFLPDTSHIEVDLPSTMDRENFAVTMWIRAKRVTGTQILVVRLLKLSEDT